MVSVTHNFQAGTLMLYSPEERNKVSSHVGRKNATGPNSVSLSPFLKAANSVSECSVLMNQSLAKAHTLQYVIWGLSYSMNFGRGKNIQTITMEKMLRQVNS